MQKEGDDGLEDRAPGTTGALRPRDAATLVVVDRSAGEPKLLMGRRRPDQVFLPGKFVFPGGRVDAEDRSAPSADELSPGEMAKLLVDMKGGASAARARALALAAVRETFEETGVLIGRPGASNEQAAGPWAPFAATGYLPALSCLTFFARAITPPGRPRRYDTRFFHVDTTAIAHTTEPLDEELLHVGWFTLSEVRELDMPGITRVIVEDLSDILNGSSDSARRDDLPFYFHRNGVFHRTLLTP